MFGWLRRAPRHVIVQRRRVLDALADYPLYEPPEWGPRTKPMREAHAEYKQFFFDNRSRRLDALGAFLAKFDVVVNLDDAGIVAVSGWFPTYADLLVEGLQLETVWAAYHGFEARWTGPLQGLNPIFDLGVYFGECLLSRKSKAMWQPSLGPEPHFVTHFISGLKGGRLFDPIDYMYTECINIRNEKLWPMGRSKLFTAPDALSRAIYARLL